MTSTKSDKAGEFISRLHQTPIAIIGMACIFPQARTLREFWNNIVDGVDSITDVPEDRWDVEEYYDPDPKAPDKTYCKRGGFIPDIDFDPMEFGIPPNVLEVTDVSHLLSLVVAKEVLEDAGYGESSDSDRDRIGIVLGVGGGQKLISPLNARLQYPVWKKVLMKSGVSEEDAEIIIEKIKKAYIPWEENSFPGMLGNVISGRITNRLNLGGINCVLDAACASSLAALKMAISELVEHRSDIMISGGVDADNSIHMYMCFSKTPAFTPDDICRPFDVNSSGMLIGEGVGMIALKRLEDAERDNDRIYAVIRGIGSSSDGRFKSIYNPRPEGQALALKRAYEDAGIPPSSVGLIEAHGTGTIAGDPAEVAALKSVFDEGNFRKQHIAIGSVKSQIGHTKAAAGIAGVIKAALALHHKVLPPTVNVTQPDPKLDLDNSSFYVNSDTRPWIQSENGTPRRAGVSAFGFGGTNFHVVLEEYQGESSSPYRLHKVPHCILLSAPTHGELRSVCNDTLHRLESEAGAKCHHELVEVSKFLRIPIGDARIGFVSGSRAETCELLKLAIDALDSKAEEESWDLPKGILYRRRGMDLDGRVVALFSGQGSQYLEMGKELVCNYPPLMDVSRAMDRLFVEDGDTPLSDKVFPKPVFDPAQRAADEEKLRQTEHAQPAIGVLSSGLYKILKDAGFQPDFVAGHSFGELTALWAADVLGDTEFLALAKARGRAMAAPDEADFDAGSMLAVIGDCQSIQTDIADYPDVTVANLNSQRQVVIAGPKQDILALRKSLEEKGYRVVPLPVSAAFHTKLVGHAQKPFADAVQGTTCQNPRCPVYSNTTGEPYPSDPMEIRKLLEGHILNPVLFKEEIENIYRDGGRIFVEFGPKGILSKLVEEILEDKPHVAIALNANHRKNSDRQLRDAIVHLRVVGLSLQDIDPYYLEHTIPEENKLSAAAVRLNGANYVSDGTRKAFADALNDGKQIQQTIPLEEAKSEPIPERERQQTIPEKAVPVELKRATAPVREPSPLPPTDEIDKKEEPPSKAVPDVQDDSTMPQPAITGNGVDAERVLESLEQSLTLFYQHQGEILQAHEHYLDNNLEYSQTFYELTRQQNSLLAQDSSADVPDSIQRGMSMFHDHQGETLRVHEQYLRNQADVSKSALEIMKDQASLLTGTSSSPVKEEPLSLTTPAALPPTSAVVETQQQSVVNEPAAAASTPVTQPMAVTAPVATGPDIEALTKTMLEVVSEKTGYPAEMLDLDMEIEADLGIDSIKRVEILGTMMDIYPDLPEINPEELVELRTLRQIADHIKSELSSGGKVAQPVAVTAPAATGPDIEALTKTMLEVVSEKTGYPAEMLDLDMEIEADLGIDSIKRVEILGTMMDIYPDLPEINPEELVELRTLRQIADHIKSELSSGGQVAQPMAVTAPVATGPDIEALTKTMLEVVSEKTGYPAEMLDLDMEIEADLGIDSIKRVEILGTMMDIYPDLPEINPEELVELRTLRQIADHIKSELSSGGQVAQSVVTEESLDPIVTTTLTKPKPSDALPLAHVELEGFTRSVLAVVGENTGYPAEMLELDMELETELGVDRIKLIEMFRVLREQYPTLRDIDHTELTELRTLEDLVVYTRKLVPFEESPRTEARPQESPVEGSISQSFARLKHLPAPDFLEFNLPDNHICLLTDDGTSATVELAESLMGGGWKVVVLSFPTSLIRERLPLSQGIHRITLEDLSEVHLEETLQNISRDFGPIGGFIHMNPPHELDPSDGILPSEAGKTLLLHVFLSAKHLKASLTQTNPPGRRFFVTVARMNGTLGVGEGEFNIVDGGLFGLTKTLNLEWESVFCRAIDLSPDLDTDQVVSTIWAELHDPDRRIVETGYGSQGRVTLVPEALDMAPPSQDHCGIDSSSVFLVSGGARGVTAECVVRLASKCHGKYILLGRSTFTGEEPEWARDCFDEAELRKRGMDVLNSQGEKPTPMKVQELLKPVLANREITRTLTAIREAGGEAEYVSVDVTDAEALQQVAPITERFGPITGIIHGAGVLADKMIEKKTIDDLEAVYSTKVKGLEALLSCVDTDKLKYLILFSSAAGFFGNPGQSDYAIANEILNKTAHKFKHKHPDCHVVSFNWGPWDGGMVTDSLKRMFAERGIQVIPVDSGAQVFVDRLTIGDSSPQILVGSSLLVEGGQVDPELRTYRVVRKLDLESNPFLPDHSIGGKPVLPAACVILWMGDVCEQLYPGYKAFRCDNFKTLKGIVFDETLAHEYIMDLRELRKTNLGEIEFDIEISSRHPQDKPIHHYSAQILLLSKTPDTPVYEHFDRTEHNTMDGMSLYQDGTLFHGSHFQAITRVINISSTKLTMECRTPEIGERGQGQFPIRAFNPYAADAQFQSMLIWVRNQFDAGSLPSKARSGEQYRPVPTDRTFYVSLDIISSTRTSMVADITTHDEMGNIYTRVFGAEVTISKNLNQLFAKVE